MSEDTEPLYESLLSYIIALAVGAMAFGPMMFPAGWLFQWMMAQPTGGMFSLLLLGPYIIAQLLILVVAPMVIGIIVGAVADDIIKSLRS